MIAALLDAGVPAEWPSWGPKGAITPLALAALRNGAAAVDLLLRAGANTETPFEPGRTALSCTTHPDVVAALVAAGADVNGGPVSPPAYWMAAIDIGSARGLRALLSCPGVDVNRPHASDGATPLHAAAVRSFLLPVPWNDHWNDAFGVEALLAAGANANAVDAEGRTPLAAARSSRQAEGDQGARATAPFHCVMTQLVAAGARNWDAVPTPCRFLEVALPAVWQPGNTEDLAQLFKRLEPGVQAVVRAALRGMHHAARPHGGLPGPLQREITRLALGGADVEAMRASAEWDA